MKKYCPTMLIMLIMSLLILSGCSNRYEKSLFWDNPDTEAMQTVLDDMSKAIISKNLNKYLLSFSSNYPFIEKETIKFKKLIIENKFETYTQNIKKTQALNDGIICTVEVTYQTSKNNAKQKKQFTKDIFFLQERGWWKIGDFNYYPIENPAIVVGSNSMLYDAASQMADGLSSRLYTDKNFLQTYGDVIMIGTAYDNAAILDLEIKNLTPLKVTDSFPGEDTGIVQVIPNISNHRYVILIQSSDLFTAEHAIQLVSQHLKKIHYLYPGVYHAKDSGLKPAESQPLNDTSSFDMDEAQKIIYETQKNIEANIAQIEHQILLQKEQINSACINQQNDYLVNYSPSFSRYFDHTVFSPNNGMTLIAANYTDPLICSKSFELPQGNTLGTVLTFSQYLNQTQLITDNSRDNRTHIKNAYEMSIVSKGYDKMICNNTENVYYNMALMRLIGFTENDIYHMSSPDHSYIYLTTDNGYILDTSQNEITNLLHKQTIHSVKYLENDGYYIDFDTAHSNMDAQYAQNLTTKLNKISNIKHSLSNALISRITFKSNDLVQESFHPYNTDDMLELLQDIVITDDSPCIYGSLEEARTNLRQTLGHLLSLKSIYFIINNATQNPGSQYDLSRYAAGLLNVTHLNTYAQSALESKEIKNYCKEITADAMDQKSLLNRITDRIQKINSKNAFNDKILYPDACLQSNIGSSLDKALVAYGLYSELSKNKDSAYIAISKNATYLVVGNDNNWKYLNCKNYSISTSIYDEIRIVFNANNTYNMESFIGEKPQFMQSY